MKQEDDIQKEVTTKDDGSFLSRVTIFFSKLMERFTNGKYSTPEEKAFFGDENNLYDEEGNLTPEYQKRIKEYEDLIMKLRLLSGIKQGDVLMSYKKILELMLSYEKDGESCRIVFWFDN